MCQFGGGRDGFKGVGKVDLEKVVVFVKRYQ